MDPLQAPAQRRRERLLLVGEGVRDRPQDQRERRAQLVADVGEEVRLRAVGQLGGLLRVAELLGREPPLGDVLRDAEQVARLAGRVEDRDLLRVDPARLALRTGQRLLGGDQPLAVEHRAIALVERPHLLGRERLQAGLAEDVLGLHPRDLLGPLVPQLEGEIRGVLQEDHHRRVLDQRVEDPAELLRLERGPIRAIELDRLRPRGVDHGVDAALQRLLARARGVELDVLREAAVDDGAQLLVQPIDHVLCCAGHPSHRPPGLGTWSGNASLSTMFVPATRCGRPPPGHARFRRAARSGASSEGWRPTRWSVTAVAGRAASSPWPPPRAPRRDRWRRPCRKRNCCRWSRCCRHRHRRRRRHPRSRVQGHRRRSCTRRRRRADRPAFAGVEHVPVARSPEAPNSWQSSAGAQFTTVLVQAPPWQVPGIRQSCPSPQAVPSLIGGAEHTPVPDWQVPAALQGPAGAQAATWPSEDDRRRTTR